MAVPAGDVKPFLLKLWKILDDETTLSDLVCWDSSGLSFHIFNSYEFSRVILSRFFKTTAISSFVRQLNLYGFKKLHDRNGESNTDHMEFSHPCFRRDHWELLSHIVRKPPSGKKKAMATSVHASGDGATGETDGCARKVLGVQSPMVMVAEKDLTELVDELRSLRVSHSSMNDTISELTKDKEVLWNEVELLRSSHLKQQQTTGRLVQFLLTMMQQSQSSNHHHHHHQKHHHPRVGVSATGGVPGVQSKAKIVPVEPYENPLALVSGFNCDVLGAIQSDMMLEELDFINCSNILPSTDIHGPLESLGTAAGSKRSRFTPTSVLDDEPLQLSGGADHPLCMWQPCVTGSGGLRLDTTAVFNEHDHHTTLAPPTLQSASNTNSLALVQKDFSRQQLVPAPSRHQQMDFADTIPSSILTDVPVSGQADDELLDDYHHLFSFEEKATLEGTNNLFDRYIPVSGGSSIPTGGMDELLTFGDCTQGLHQLTGNGPNPYEEQDVEGEELIDDGVQPEEIIGYPNMNIMPELLYSPSNR